MRIGAKWPVTRTDESSGDAYGETYSRLNASELAADIRFSKRVSTLARVNLHETRVVSSYAAGNHDARAFSGSSEKKKKISETKFAGEILLGEGRRFLVDGLTTFTGNGGSKSRVKLLAPLVTPPATKEFQRDRKYDYFLTSDRYTQRTGHKLRSLSCPA